MQFYLILLALFYLVVSFISIFKMEVIFTRILRIIMGVLLLFVVALTTMSFPKENWWVFIVLLLLVGNVEVTGFKMLKRSKRCKHPKFNVIIYLCHILHLDHRIILSNKQNMQ